MRRTGNRWDYARLSTKTLGFSQQAARKAQMTPAAFNFVKENCEKEWVTHLHARMREVIAGKVDDEVLAESVEAVHGLVCRLGGPRAFGRILHAAVMDDRVGATAKAELLTAIAGMWAIASKQFEEAESEWTERLSDEELQASLENFARRFSPQNPPQSTTHQSVPPQPASS